MKWWRHKARADEPPVDAAHDLDEWSVTIPMEDGGVLTLQGLFDGGTDPQLLRCLHAIRDGLRTAGYEPELALTHRTRMVEP